MRNLKRALSLALASVMVLGLMVVGSGASYKDVSSEHNQEAIEVLQAVGIMVGDDNGNFNPEAKVTRNEMAVIMSNLMDYRVATYSGTSPFTDVPAWAEPYVAACWTNGITAGYTATTYGGSDTVTTAQAALMVMKALGYFQYQADFKDDWQLETVSQANKIDLFDDVESGVREAMTRNDVAQLVLNALEAGTVEADSDVTKVEAGDVKVETGKTTYKFITSGKDYAEAIDDKLATYTDGSYSSGKIVELGEKLYNGDLTKDEDYDDFGRPASIWEYEGKEIGKYADDADYTYTAKVTSKVLYNDLGRTAVDYAKWTVSLNGEPVDYDGSDLTKNKTEDDTDFVKAALGGNDAYTDNGTLTQVYVDATDRTVTISIIEYYAAEVLKVDEDDGTITLSALYGDAKTTDEFETTDFEEDDIVLYSYANDDIQEVYAAELMEGEVTRVRSKTSSGSEGDGDNFTVDGTTYKYNKTLSGSDRLTTDNVNNNVVVYLDRYGYVSYIDESAITYDYAYVLSMGTESGKYGSDPKGDTYFARLVLTDGYMIKVETDEHSDDLVGHIVSYSADKDDVYTLKDKSAGRAIAAADYLNIENGVSSFQAENRSDEAKGKNYAANSNTVFIVADPDQDSYDDYDFTVYTGVKNVPDIEATTGSTKAVVATEKDSNVAKVVYIEDASTSGDDVIFVRADSAAKLIKDSEIGNYYEINAYMDGAKTTLNVKEGSSAERDLVSKIQTAQGLSAGSGSTKTLLALKSVSTNADDLVTSVKLYGLYDDGDGIITGWRTEKAEKDAVGLLNNTTGITGFAWDDEVVVVRYNENNKGEMNGTRISSIKDDPNDTYIAVLDGDVLTGLLVIDVPDGTSSGSETGDVKLPDNAEIDTKALTVDITAAKGTSEYDLKATAKQAIESQGFEVTSYGSISNGKFTVTAKKDGISVDFTVTVTEYITITVDGKVKQTFKSGEKCEKIEMKDFEGVAGYLWSTDNGKSYVYYSNGSGDIAEKAYTDNVIVKTGYVKLDDQSSTTVTTPDKDSSKTPVYYAAANSSVTLTFAKAGSYAVNGEPVVIKEDKGTVKVTTTDKDITVVDYQGAEALGKAVSDAYKAATEGKTPDGIEVKIDGQKVTVTISKSGFKDSGLMVLVQSLVEADCTVTVKDGNKSYTLTGNTGTDAKTLKDAGLVPTVANQTVSFTVEVTNANDVSVEYNIAVKTAADYT